MKKSLALFDFDGTITTKDSLVDFLQYSFGYTRFLQAIIATFPYLLSFKLGLYPNSRAKERLLINLIEAMPVETFEQLGHNYAINKLPSIIRPSAIQKIRWHQTQGHELLVVSASIDVWLKPWCEDMQMSLLSTVLETKDGCMTGNISGDNCFGAKKVELIKLHYDLSEYETIYAYGDSKGDREMLAVADKAFMRVF